MNLKKGEKAKELSSFRHFLYCLYGHILSLFAFDRTEAVRWSPRTAGHMTTDPGTVVTVSRPWPFPALLLAPTTSFTWKKKKKEKKNTFYIPQIFMHISQYTFITILINTKKKNDTVIPKENNGY